MLVKLAAVAIAMLVVAGAWAIACLAAASNPWAPKPLSYSLRALAASSNIAFASAVAVAVAGMCYSSAEDKAKRVATWLLVAGVALLAASMTLLVLAYPALVPHAVD